MLLSVRCDNRSGWRQRNPLSSCMLIWPGANNKNAPALPSGLNLKSMSLAAARVVDYVPSLAMRSVGAFSATLAL